MKNTLSSIYNTLSKVEVKGEENCLRMYLSMKEVRELANKLNSEVENNGEHSGTTEVHG